MELLDIGSELKAERERRGITLEKVNEDTKIGIYFLDCLEQGKLDQMPHPVYARGFVQNYARYLGLDWKRIGDDFSSLYFAEDHFSTMNAEDLPTSLRVAGKTEDYSKYIKLLVMGLALAIVVGFGWFVYSSFSERSAGPGPEQVFQGSDQDVGVSDLVLEPDPEVNDPQAYSPSQEDQSASALPSSPPSEPDFPGLSEISELPQEVQDFNQQESSASHDPEPVGQAGLPDQPEVLEIRAREDCWLMAVADGAAREVYLRAGERIRLEFMDQIRVTFGNAGGVDILLNNSEYPFEARSGEVKTLEVTASSSAR
ncbi:helix-turn-helix domain-containing protein [Desulfonatronovibrio hydrogenovorans]|uniref:helix-turn-helix domain-containing protein n=1 Tax=Desulfonatronovibrio hydrogenovorans TaxID=53245 RepID=UPI00048FC1A8|nr:RodZ domain-containing protein [Desulfonatronovibrio hydrogenovorans]